MLLTSLICWHCSWSISQGELVDRIEHHVESSRDAVESGGEDIRKGRGYQRKARKVMCEDGGG
jgi:t-SNARE complex subunit (syntaxin)